MGGGGRAGDDEQRRRDDLRVLAAGHGGVFSVGDAQRLGFTRGRRRALVAADEWVVLRPGVLAEARVVELAARDPRGTHALNTAAALAAMTLPAAAYAVSAASVLRLDLPGPPPDRPRVVLPPSPRAGGRSTNRLAVRRAGLPAAHVTTIAGVRTAGAARTVADMARALAFDEAVVLADSAYRTWGAEICAQLQQMVHHCAGWPGGAAIEPVLAFADVRCESGLESRGRLVMHRQGLPPPATQCWVGESRPEFRADFGWEELRTIGEADGRVKYVHPDVLWKQARREERLHDLRFEVVRFDAAGVAREAELAGRFRRAFDRGRPGRGRFFPDPGWWSPGGSTPVPYERDGTPVAWWLHDPDELRELFE
ncbi:MAG: hypothetical protein ACRDWY_04850 [Actinomycetes bacterium]